MRHFHFEVLRRYPGAWPPTSFNFNEFDRLLLRKLNEFERRGECRCTDLSVSSLLQTTIQNRDNLPDNDQAAFFASSAIPDKMSWIA